MRTKLIFITIILILSASLDVHAAAGRGLRFSVIFDKEEYTTNDHIKINFRLENKGKKEVLVNTRFFLNDKKSAKKERDIYLEVISPSGEELPLKRDRETGLPRTDDFILLKPGEEKTTKRPFNITYFYDFKEPGAYKVTAVYENFFGDEIGLKEVFKDRLRSKEIKIKVVK